MKLLLDLHPILSLDYEKILPKAVSVQCLVE